VIGDLGAVGSGSARCLRMGRRTADILVCRATALLKEGLQTSGGRRQTMPLQHQLHEARAYPSLTWMRSSPVVSALLRKQTPGPGNKDTAVKGGDYQPTRLFLSHRVASLQALPRMKRAECQPQALTTRVVRAAYHWRRDESNLSAKANCQYCKVDQHRQWAVTP
jgi:hypothetical protein